MRNERWLSIVSRLNDGYGCHPRSSRINPQGDNGAAGVREWEDGGGRKGVTK